MPRNAWLLNPVARWREFTVIEVLRTEWSSPWRGEEQIVRAGFCPVGTLRFEHFTKSRADRKHAIAAVRLRSAEITVRKYFGNFESLVQQIHTLPTKPENLADLRRL
jgi:hypothetical protein